MMDAREQLLIGVIIPAFNVASLIDRCLDSLAAQTFSHWCAVIVDDGSTDGTTERIEARAHMDERFVLIRGTHQGVSQARNAALDALRGMNPDYVTFLDSDDYLDSDALEMLLNLSLGADADVVQCNYYSEYTGGYTYVPKAVFPEGSVYSADRFGRTLYWNMVTGIQMNHVCASFYRAALLHGTKFDSRFVTGEDLLFNMEVFSRARIYAYTAKPYYHYLRDFTGGLTNSGVSNRDKLRMNWRLSREMLRRMPTWGVNPLLYGACILARPGVLVFSKTYRHVRSKVFGKRTADGKVSA